MTHRMDDLQVDAWAWHTKRFPNASLERVGLKMGEEAGEVAEAINGLVGEDSATGGGDVLSECADVVICALVIASRWCDEDLGIAVRRKLDILLDPHSGHRAAVLEDS